MNLLNLNQKNIMDFLHLMATAIGAYGGFPPPPPIFKKLTEYELFQWSLVFILCYQGAAEEDYKTALISTVILYIIHKLLFMLDKKKDKENKE